MARPAKLAHEKREARPNPRYTTAEIEHIREQATLAHLSVPEYIRRRSLGHVVAPPRSAVDAKLVTRIDRLSLELKALGNNVNQLARAAHSGRAYRGLPVADLRVQLDGLFPQLEATLAAILSDVRHDS